MNYSVIRNILGKMLLALAAMMVLPLIVSFIYQEGMTHYLAYIIPIAVLVLIGFLCNIKKAENPKMLAREGIVIVGLSWLLISLFGCIPFMLTGEIPNFFDAFFEASSGFTTTGASVVTDVTSLSHSVLFWRSFSHWVGGMGILVFILAIIPESKDGSALHILKAESPGPQVGRLVSKMQVTSRILYLIYFVLTLALFLLLWLGPDKQMDLFNSILYSIGTAGTGGFAAHPQSLEYFSNYSQYVIAIFMFIFGVNFSLYYFLLIKNFKDIYKNDEIKWYGVIVAASVIIIGISIYPIYQNFEQVFRLSFFQVGTIISTSGYSTANFNEWPSLAKVVLFILTFIGGCAGSTAGGFKLSRVIILFKSALRKFKNMIHPRKVEVINVDGKPLTDDTIESVQNYFIIYVIVFLLCLFLISIDGFDLETNISAAAACFNNVGPGFGLVGPYGSYSIFSGFSKLILSITMLIGRLELFPILLLFTPTVWRKRN